MLRTTWYRLAVPVISALGRDTCCLWLLAVVSVWMWRSLSMQIYGTCYLPVTFTCYKLVTNVLHAAAHPLASARVLFAALVCGENQVKNAKLWCLLRAMASEGMCCFWVVQVWWLHSMCWVRGCSTCSAAVGPYTLRQQGIYAASV
jgi:hypothetical protein